MCAFTFTNAYSNTDMYEVKVFRSHPLPPAPVTDELWPAREPTGATSNSERLRSAPRTCRSLRGRLSMRETHRMGWDQTHVSHETPRVHIAPERRGSRVAARGARAAAGDADDRTPAQRLT